MNRKSEAFRLLWTNAKQDTLASDGIFALAVGLFTFALALVAVLLIISHTNPEISPAIADGVGVSSARWSVLGQFYSPDSEGSAGSSVALALSASPAIDSAPPFTEAAAPHHGLTR